MIKAPVIGRFFICLKLLHSAYESGSNSAFYAAVMNCTGDGALKRTEFFMQCIAAFREKCVILNPWTINYLKLAR